MLKSIYNLIAKYKEIATIFIAFIIGFSVSSGLLFYSGKKLVNSLIYLAIVVFIPFIFSTLSLFTLFFKRKKYKLESLKISYIFGIFFSIGAISSLLFLVVTQDLAFGWATTLDIKPSELSNLLDKIAIWKNFCPKCIVDEKLVELSQFTRLGGAITKEQIHNAKELGNWWRYIAMAILFYGVLYRAILLFIAKILQKEKTLKIVSDKNQERIDEFSSEYKNRISLQDLKSREFKAIGYYIDVPKELNSIDESDNLVVVVKSWEPPIMDFFDYLEELKKEYKKITIYLVGLKGKANKSDVDIWLRKLNELNLDYEVAI